VSVSGVASSASQTWFPFRKSTPGGSVRLVCLPFVGGSAAAFRFWRDLAPGVELCAAELPGRATRMGEAPLTAMNDVIAGLARALGELDAMPTVFFGHSMGAHIAHRLAFALEQAGAKGPDWVVVSAARAPSPPRNPSRWRCRQSDERLLNFLAALGGTPEELLADEALRAMVLPLLRADFELIESLLYEAPLVLGANIAAFAGANDRMAPPAALKAWREQTSGRFLSRNFSGGHFYFQTGESDVSAALRAIIDALPGLREIGVGGRRDG
jgi:surfactin synthase thioesterase subunit